MAAFCLANATHSYFLIFQFSVILDLSEAEDEFPHVKKLYQDKCQQFLKKN